MTKEQTEAITTQINVTNPHLKYDEQLSRGYGLLTANDGELAQRLGISRKTLWEKRRRYGL